MCGQAAGFPPGMREAFVTINGKNLMAKRQPTYAKDVPEKLARYRSRWPILDENFRRHCHRLQELLRDIPWGGTRLPVWQTYVAQP